MSRRLVVLCVHCVYMPRSDASRDIDNVVIKTEVATTDELHVDILDAVLKTH
jgi:hypothetical protein